MPRELDHEGQVQWLYDWWERIDTWISESRPGGATVLEVAPMPEDETAEPVGELPASRGRQHLPVLGYSCKRTCAGQRAGRQIRRGGVDPGLTCGVQ